MSDPSNLKEAQALVNKLSEISSNMRQAANLADAFSQSIARMFPNDNITVSAPVVTGKKRGRAPKEGKRIKDPNAPKRPATSYILFQNDIRDELKAKNPGLPYKELLGKVSEAWQKLAETEKKNYQNQADENMAKYNRAVLDYKGVANGHPPPSVTEPTPEVDEEEEEEEEPAHPAKKQKAATPEAESSEEEEEEESDSEPAPPPPPPPAKKPNLSTGSKCILGPKQISTSTLALQRRCASTSSKSTKPTKSPSIVSTRPFPPPEGISSNPASTKFDAKVWASLQPPPLSALSALAARLRIPVSDSNAKSAITLPLLAQAVTHPSFIPLHQHYYPHELPPAHNGMLAALGNSLMGLFATEWLAATYPHLPTLVLKAAVSACVGPASACAVAREWGAVPLVRWQRKAETEVRSAVMFDDAVASVARAFTGLVYHAAGSMDDARTFVHAHFLSREFDLRTLLKFGDPKLALINTVKKYQREPPVSRLLSESGRASNSPTFIVGVFSGPDKLGEGFGSSLRMAEHRAAEDAMHRLYLTRQPSSDFKLPTAAFPSTGDPSVVEALAREEEAESPFKLLALSSLPARAESAESQHTPGILGDSEMQYGSAGRSGRLAREKPST
ncbi:hypothetical protein FRC07_012553 [Ceratobasidium sp. 392]|nr:hypothetical protein FRC07_012553 [Ceratobasidium sp. 392]